MIEGRRHLEMLNTAFGAAITDYLENPNIIEIMVNPDGKLWIEEFGKGKYFTNITLEESQTANIIKLVAAHRHDIADREHPEVATELPGSGARFQGWLPPISSAPTFTIRKRATRIFSLDDYVEANSISASLVAWLRQAIKERKNILIAGGTGSGKTTFANALLLELKNSKDRIVILEDLPELQIAAEDYVKLRTSDQKSMRELVKGVLRMRPDRIIIGEVRDGAALDLLKAWNTGHPGGICTIHANSPDATLSRLEDLIHEAANIAPQRLIFEAIDIIIFMYRNDKGEYKIASINSCTKGDDGEYKLQDINLM